MEIYKTLSKLLIKNKKSYIYLNIYVFVPPCSGRGVSCSGLLLRFLSGVSLGGVPLRLHQFVLLTAGHFR